MRNCEKPGKTCSRRVWRPTHIKLRRYVSGKAPVSDSTVAEDTFQRGMKQTMEKLKECDDTIKVQVSLLQ
jgi:hypothetical protein